MRVRINGAWREVTGGRIRIGGAWKELTSVRVRVGGAWKDAESFFAPFTALTVAPDEIERSGQVGDILVTQSSVATPTGGLPPFTYSWARVSGDTGIVITSPTSASTTFRRSLDTETTYLATFRCTCTDALGVSHTDDVFLSLTGFDLTFP